LSWPEILPRNDAIRPTENLPRRRRKNGRKKGAHGKKVGNWKKVRRRDSYSQSEYSPIGKREQTEKKKDHFRELEGRV